MKKIGILILFALFIIGCDFRNNETTKNIIKKDSLYFWSKFTLIDSVVVSNTDFLNIISSTYGKFLFDTNSYLCKMENDTIYIEGHATANEAEIPRFNNFFIKLHNGFFSFQFMYEQLSLDLNQRERVLFSTNLQNLKVNNIHFLVNDSLFLDIKYLGVSKNKLDGTKEYIEIFGKIKMKIMDSLYNYQLLRRDQERVKIWSLLNTNRPDTVIKEWTSPDGNNQFTDLNIHSLGIKELPIQLKKFKKVKSISFYGDDLENANFIVLKDFKEIQYLVISSSGLRIFPRVIYGLKHLKYLDLSQNNIINIDTVLFKELKELEFLDLSYNKNLNLNTIVFLRKRSIKELKLDGCINAN